MRLNEDEVGIWSLSLWTIVYVFCVLRALSGVMELVGTILGEISDLLWVAVTVITDHQHSFRTRVFLLFLLA